MLTERRVRLAALVLFAIFTLAFTYLAGGVAGHSVVLIYDLGLGVLGYMLAWGAIFVIAFVFSLLSFLAAVAVFSPLVIKQHRLWKIAKAQTTSMPLANAAEDSKSADRAHHRYRKSLIILASAFGFLGFFGVVPSDNGTLLGIPLQSASLAISSALPFGMQQFFTSSATGYTGWALTYFSYLFAMGAGVFVPVGLGAFLLRDALKVPVLSLGSGA